AWTRGPPSGRKVGIGFHNAERRGYAARTTHAKGIDAMAAAAVEISPRTITAGRAGVAGWTGPLRRSAWTVALVTALGAALGLLLVVHRDHRYAAHASVVLDSSAGSSAER